MVNLPGKAGISPAPGRYACHGRGARKCSPGPRNGPTARRNKPVGLLGGRLAAYF